MMNSSIYRIRTLLSLNSVTSTSPSPKHFPFSLAFSTNTSDSPSFPVTYLINTFGFSPKSASKLCSIHNLRFKTSQNPDSVITFFKSHGFSDTQLRHMIGKAPWLLSCDPCKRVLPKFEFLASKGSTTSDIVSLVSKTPFVLSPSLKNQLVPAYEFYYTFLKSDKDTIALLNCNPFVFGDTCSSRNIRVLVENGVTESNIAKLLHIWFRVFQTCDNKMLKIVDELMDMGFDPSKSSFAIALQAKVSVSTTLWNETSDVFKKWGWSAKHIMDAFRRYPHCMLASVDKINLVKSFWVIHLGWDSLELANAPRVINLSMEGRIIPRSPVVQFLLEKGLRKMNASLASPFTLTDKLFLETFIKCYKDESSYLLNLYQEKLNSAYNWNKTSMPRTNF